MHVRSFATRQDNGAKPLRYIAVCRTDRTPTHSCNKSGIHITQHLGKRKPAVHLLLNPDTKPKHMANRKYSTRFRTSMAEATPDAAGPHMHDEMGQVEF